MGVYDHNSKKGDGSASGKQQASGGKGGYLTIRRGRIYDEQGRENTLKDGELEISMSAYQTLRTTTDGNKTGLDRSSHLDEAAEKLGARQRPPTSNRFLHSNNFQRYFEENSEDQPKFGWLALEWSRKHGYTQPSKRMIINGILTEVKNHWQ